MKYLVSEHGPLRIGGVMHKPGEVVELFGVQQRAFFGTRLVDITDPLMIRALDVNSVPYFVMTATRWGRHDYVPGDIYWAANRSIGRMVTNDRCQACNKDWQRGDEDSELQHMESCAGEVRRGWARPATGQEVIDFARRTQGLDTPREIRGRANLRQGPGSTPRIGRRHEGETETAASSESASA